MLISICFSWWWILGFYYSNVIRETSGFELVSTISISLQANRLTKRASHPKMVLNGLDLVKNSTTFLSTQNWTTASDQFLPETKVQSITFTKMSNVANYCIKVNQFITENL